ncbi:MAG: hypothetical protein Ct9H90mP20_3580 [Candidatus Neomarinimicrobiota bacterium]|nr:MAG: hypothetical protein Ct9H90mP20_3580 [Candidatus Neomarinimicrobiota bacterium]
MIFFAPFLLALIHFYAFNTHSFVFSFLGSFIAFHTLEAMFINSLFNHKQKKILMILGGEKSTDQSVTQQVADYIIGHVSNSDQAHPIYNYLVFLE